MLKVIREPRVFNEAARLCAHCSHGHRVALLRILVNAVAHSTSRSVIISLTSQYIHEIEMLIQLVCSCVPYIVLF
jgi:hypothetical protein